MGIETGGRWAEEGGVAVTAQGSSSVHGKICFVGVRTQMDANAVHSVRNQFRDAIFLVYKSLSLGFQKDQSDFWETPKSVFGDTKCFFRETKNVIDIFGGLKGLINCQNCS